MELDRQIKAEFGGISATFRQVSGGWGGEYNLACACRRGGVKGEELSCPYNLEH